MAEQIVTRFAPSPTGYLHIGGARTALFNWLFARGRGGRFLLRIEDTDHERSTPQATQAIIDGLAWLGLDHDGEIVSQAARADRHRAVALELLEAGAAYKCFSTQEEIQAFRDAAKAEGRSTLFRSPWRDTNPSDHPDAPYALRLKAPRDGETLIADQVQGDVRIRNDQLDDMILLRSDGSPVYMLAVVVDDHDMGVTHVIRGDDHLNNAARQMGIYQAMGWPLPVYAHIPLIHGPDGKKLSKRHGALGVEEYRDMGYPAAGMRNYLARLGWSHGDDEVFTDTQAQDWFGFDGMGKSPARFDFKKLENICGHHMAAAEDAALLHELEAWLTATGRDALSDGKKSLLAQAMPLLKERAKTFPEVIEKAAFVLTDRPIVAEEKAAKHLDDNARQMLSELTPRLQNASWNRSELEETLNGFAEGQGVKFGKLAGPLRAALAGRAATPSVFDMLLVLGREESILRIADAATAAGA
ncbi:glutamate--tRNA ligase [Pseudooceanicola aestuarii]|uniref:glutamate--tRNA ligase n=1 Tax=Pseudooceanicola aestuarii TaxID=2697319 RepID=UPI0013D34147|nr:glutamate--tRNA ligase [Pseudooceanicola aestuarii]